MKAKIFLSLLICIIVLFTSCGTPKTPSDTSSLLTSGEETENMESSIEGLGDVSDTLSEGTETTSKQNGATSSATKPKPNPATTYGTKNSNGTVTVYVTKNGSNDNNGTKDKPLASIEFAMEVLKAGDTCLVGAGTYHEMIVPPSGSPGKPVTVKAMDGARPTIMGTLPFKGEWKLYKNNIYVADVSSIFYDMDVNDYQVFANGVPGVEARWPNLNSKDINGIMSYKREVAQAGTNYKQLVVKNAPSVNLSGCYATIFTGTDGGSGWTTFSAKVATVKSGNQLIFKDGSFKNSDNRHDLPYIPCAGNAYYLHGSLELLDAPGEYYFDEGAKKFYFYTPDGKSPANYEISFRATKTSVVMSNSHDIVFDGFNVVGGAISLEDSSNCVVKNCSFMYSEHIRLGIGYNNIDKYRGNIVSGKNNKITKCDFGITAGNAISIGGEGIVFTNNKVHEASYAGCSNSAISLQNKVKNAVISNNSIKNSGGTHISSPSNGEIFNVVIEKNHFANHAIINSDCGMCQFFMIDGHGTEIRYNLVEGGTGGDNGSMMKIVEGIYIDSYCKNFSVHHNVVKDIPGCGLRANLWHNNNSWTNNTVINCEYGVGSFGAPEDANMVGTVMANNIFAGIKKNAFTYYGFLNGKDDFLNGDITDGKLIYISKVENRMNSYNNVQIPLNGVDAQYRPVSSTKGIGAVQPGESMFKTGTDW